MDDVPQLSEHMRLLKVEDALKLATEFFEERIQKLGLFRPIIGRSRTVRGFINIFSDNYVKGIKCPPSVKYQIDVSFSN